MCWLYVISYMLSTFGQWNNVVERDSHSVITPGETVDTLTAQVADPPMVFKDFCMVDLLSALHDGTSLRGIVIPSHITLRIMLD